MFNYGLEAGRQARADEYRRTQVKQTDATSVSPDGARGETYVALNESRGRYGRSFLGRSNPDRTSPILTAIVRTIFRSNRRAKT